MFLLCFFAVAAIAKQNSQDSNSQSFDHGSSRSMNWATATQQQQQQHVAGAQPRAVAGEQLVLLVSPATSNATTACWSCGVRGFDSVVRAWSLVSKDSVLWIFTFFVASTLLFLLVTTARPAWKHNKNMLVYAVLFFIFLNQAWYTHNEQHCTPHTRCIPQTWCLSRYINREATITNKAQHVVVLGKNRSLICSLHCGSKLFLWSWITSETYTNTQHNSWLSQTQWS